MSEEIIQNYKNLIEEKQSQVEKAREILENQESRKNNLVQQIEEIQASLDKNNEELTKKTSILKQAQNKLAEINTQIEAINDKIASLSKEVVSEDDDLLSLMGVEQSDTNSNQVEIDKLNLELESLSSTKNKFEIGIENVTNTISQLNSESSDYDESLAKLSEAFNSQDQKNANITEAIAKAEAKIAFYNEQITLLESLEDDGLEALLVGPEDVTNDILNSVAEVEPLEDRQKREEVELSEMFEKDQVGTIAQFIMNLPQMGENKRDTIKTYIDNITRYFDAKRLDNEPMYTREVLVGMLELANDEYTSKDELSRELNEALEGNGYFNNYDTYEDVQRAMNILQNYILDIVPTTRTLFEKDSNNNSVKTDKVWWKN